MQCRALTQFFGTLLLVLLFAGGVQAATIFVTTTADGGKGSLRAAVMNAAPGDLIRFASATNGQMISLTSGEIPVAVNLTIEGNGPDQTLISGSGQSRIFYIDGATVEISGVTLRNGLTPGSGGAILAMGANLTFQESKIMNSVAQGTAVGMGGGAIANMGGGSLFVEDVTFTGNRANGASGSGGAILNGTGGAMIVFTSSFAQNSASRAGGGIEDASDAGTSVTIKSTDFTGNVTGNAPGNGGAIHISGAGDMSITFGTVADNIAAREGGGFWNGSGTMTVSKVDFSNNAANGPAADDGGGALFNNGGTLIVSGGTISDNTALGAAGSGGGIFNATGGTLDVNNVRLTGNRSRRAGGGIEDASGAGTTVTLFNPYLFGNTTGGAPGNGGGIHITGAGDLTMTRGAIINNTATTEGGGLWNGSGTMILDRVNVYLNTASGNSADQGGGGIFNLSGELILRNFCQVRSNNANGTAGSGGGILNDTGGTLTITDAQITSNFASRAGGGIEDNSGAGTIVTIENSSLSYNRTGSAPGNGGAVHITGAGDLTISGGFVFSNRAAAEGGGLWNGTGTMIVDGVSIRSNRASGAPADQGGGGLFNNGGELIVRNGTIIQSNRADGTSGSGGGIFNEIGGTLTVMNSTIKRNTANRAGGGIEDNSQAGTLVTLVNTDLIENETGIRPGNGGGMHISGNGDAAIQGGTVSGNVASREGGGLWNGSGTMTVTGVTISNNVAQGPAADDGGGGLFNNGGALVVEDSEISDNTATGSAGSGGGIFNATGGTLAVSGSTLTGNSSVRAGGGIEDASGMTVTLVNTDFLNNTTGGAPGNGGALHVTGSADVDYTGGTVSGNVASREGGGLWNGSGTMTVTGVTISNNVAQGPAADDGGGGLFNNGGALVVEDTEISDNFATGSAGSGGGIFNATGGTLAVSGSTLTGNSSVRAGGGIEDASGMTVTLVNTDFLNNTTGGAPGNGGALHVTGSADVDYTGGTVSGNVASREGGGLWNGSGTMTVTGVTISDNVAQGPAADDGGGGLFNNGGALVVEDSEISGNTATGMAGSGGGIFNATGGTLSVTGSTLTGNSSVRAGGGIEDASGMTVTLVNTDFLNNTTGGAPGNGGALHVTGSADVDYTGGTVSGNVASREGGGLWNGSGTMTITMVSIDNNEAQGPAADDGGGGVFNNGGTVVIERSTLSHNLATGTAGNGGGFFNLGTQTSTIQTSTLSGNSATGQGGGVFNDATLIVNNSTIAQNSAADGGGSAASALGSTTLFSTIVALNTAASMPNLTGPHQSQGWNLIEKASGFTAQNSDQVGTAMDPVDPMLEPLAANGGPTATHALECGSPAIDAGAANDTSLDQRGEDIFGGIRDIGAFERQTSCGGWDGGFFGWSAREQETTLTVPDLESSEIYPNPATAGPVTLAIPESFGAQVTVQLLDMTGRIVQSTVVEPGLREWNLGRQTAGTYLVRITTENQVVTHKLILRR